MYIGLAVTSHDNTALGTGVFDNVSIAIHPRNLPPTVRLTTPANGSTFRDPADVMLIAEASDPDDGVSWVQFQAWFDGQWSGLAIDAAAPWSTVWPNVRTGTVHGFVRSRGILPTLRQPLGSGDLYGHRRNNSKVSGLRATSVRSAWQAGLWTGIRSSSRVRARTSGAPRMRSTMRGAT